jgi:hypothetical protein
MDARKDEQMKKVTSSARIKTEHFTGAVLVHEDGSWAVVGSSPNTPEGCTAVLNLYTSIYDYVTSQIK